VPSAKKLNISNLLAVAVIVGAVPLGYLTVDQVTEREPVASCFNMMIKDLPAVAVGIVIVALPVRVIICTVPLVKAKVIAVELLAVNGVSV
jgi:hypothetical protein